MKKISFKKISLLAVLILVLFISAISPASFSRAEDDDEEDNDRFWFLGREEREEDEWGDEDEEGWGENENEDEDEDEWGERGDESIPETSVIIGAPDNALNLATLVDSDQDGIIDLADKHPGEDDYAYLLLDKNKNGISDNLEILLK